MTSLKVRSDGVAWRQVGDDVVVLDERASKYLQVQGSGTVLWPDLVEGTTLDHLAGVLVERFGIDEATARRDVQTLVDDLDRRDLLDTPPA